MTPDRRAPATRLRVGRAMQVLAIAAAAAAIAGAIVGWQLVGRLDATVGESIDITANSLATLEATIELADETVTATGDGLAAGEATLRTVVSSTADVAAVVVTAAEVADEVGPSLQSVETTLRDLAGVGATIDAVLRQLDAIPFGPEYDPEVALGEQFEQLADDIDPVAAALQDAAEPLDGVGSTTEALDADLTALADALAEVGDVLDTSGPLLDAYREEAGRARILADDARDDVDGDLLAARVLVVVVALLIAAGQLVPWWVGTELRAETLGELARATDRT